MRFWASEIATAVGGVLDGEDIIVDGVGIDSRELPAAALFVPVVDVRDGHDFIADALERGASAFLTGRPLAVLRLDVGAHSHSATPERGPILPDGVAAIEVADPAAALSALGHQARRRLAAVPGPTGAGGVVIGITGSVGKTTTKDLLAGALATTFRTAASVRSFNNELGVPLTLANAPDDTEVVVVEMGARGRGHIAELCVVAEPTIGVVTTVEMVHTELFGTIAEVAEAKGELIAALPASGVAVLNGDNPLVAAMAARTGARVLLYGAEPGSAASAASAVTPEVWASAVTLDAELRPRFRLHSPWGEVEVALSIRGEHNVANAVAAAATALVTGAELAAVADGLAQAQGSPWRMDLQRTVSGARILNDAYNAGPASMAAALRSLRALGAARAVAVLGPMAELGDGGFEAHRAIVALAASLGIQVIAVDAPDYGDEDVEAVPDLDAAHVLLVTDGPLGPDDAVLVKGSRVAGLDRLARRLLDD